jgi:hypothetical protein
LPKYEYCRYRKILGNTGNTSIADTERFWKILVISVLQILEDSGKYWLYFYGGIDGFYRESGQGIGRAGERRNGIQRYMQDMEDLC